MWALGKGLQVVDNTLFRLHDGTASSCKFYNPYDYESVAYSKSNLALFLFSFSFNMLYNDPYGEKHYHVNLLSSNQGLQVWYILTVNKNVTQLSYCVKLHVLLPGPYQMPPPPPPKVWTGR